VKGFLLLALLGLFASCGGEIHFVKGPKPAEPTPGESPGVTVQESFLYGRPSGIPVVVFVIWPRKSMAAVQAELYASLPTFVQALSTRSEDGSPEAYSQIDYAFAAKLSEAELGGMALLDRIRRDFSCVR